MGARLAWLVIAAAACGGGRPRGDTEGPGFTVTAELAGASALTVEASVVNPLEQALGQIAGIRTMRSTSRAGHAQVLVVLEDADRLDAALAEAQRGIGAVLKELPPEVSPPSIRGERSDARPALWLEVADPARNRFELTKLADESVKRRLERMNGVGRIMVVGGVARSYAVVVEPAKLAAYGLVVADVLEAIRNDQLRIPGGRTGDPAIALRIDARTDAKALRELVLVARPDGAQVRLVDVARIEERFTDEEPRAAVPGPPRLAIHLQRGADPIETLAAIGTALAEHRRTLPPGVTVTEVPRPPVPPRPAFVAILRGPDWERLGALADTAVRELRAVPGVTAVETDRAAPTPEQTIAPDRAAAARLGVATHDIVTTVAALMGGPVAIVYGDSEMTNVELRLAGDTPLHAQLAQVTVHGRDGVIVPLSAVAAVTTGVAEVITHVDRERAITISVVAGEGKAPRRARDAFEAVSKTFPVGYRATISH